MESFKDRLFQLIQKHADGKPTVFAKKVGIPTGTFHNYISSDALPRPEHLIRLAEYAGVTLDWLLTGEGVKERVPAMREKGVKYLAEGELPPEAETARVDVYSMAGAGMPKDLTEYEPVDTIWIPREFVSPDIVPVKVRGKSMYPIIRDGAYVGVNHTEKSVVSGEIYAVWMPYEGAVIKRLFVDKERVLVRSDNPEFPEYSYTFKELEEAYGDNFILGRVRWVMQKL